MKRMTPEEEKAWEQLKELLDQPLGLSITDNSETGCAR